MKKIKDHRLREHGKWIDIWLVKPEEAMELTASGKMKSDDWTAMNRKKTLLGILEGETFVPWCTLDHAMRHEYIKEF